MGPLDHKAQLLDAHNAVCMCLLLQPSQLVVFSIPNDEQGCNITEGASPDTVKQSHQNRANMAAAPTAHHSANRTSPRLQRPGMCHAAYTPRFSMLHFQTTNHHVTSHCLTTRQPTTSPFPCLLPEQQQPPSNNCSLQAIPAYLPCR
jgi:hypothetical protein